LKVAQGITDERHVREWDVEPLTDLMQKTRPRLATIASIVRTVRTEKNGFDLTTMIA
jgi:hypothetical protein